jgi:hypothetical protein
VIILKQNLDISQQDTRSKIGSTLLALCQTGTRPVLRCQLRVNTTASGLPKSTRHLETASSLCHAVLVWTNDALPPASRSMFSAMSADLDNGFDNQYILHEKALPPFMDEDTDNQLDSQYIFRKKLHFHLWIWYTTTNTPE